MEEAAEMWNVLHKRELKRELSKDKFKKIEMRPIYFFIFNGA